jgi:type I restriction-modification system DNA methylase subunit
MYSVSMPYSKTVTMTTTEQNNKHQDLVGFIWSIADKLRGPYRPPQYRRVMLPLIVLRRLDLVLKPTKDKVLAAKTKYEAMGLKDAALEKAIAKVALGSDRKQPFYKTGLRITSETTSVSFREGQGIFLRSLSLIKKLTS